MNMPQGSLLWPLRYLDDTFHLTMDAVAGEHFQQLIDNGDYYFIRRVPIHRIWGSLFIPAKAAPFAAVEEISYYEDRKLDKAQMLRFSTCKFVDEGHHIILKGASGNGKTYIACAFGNAACRRFKKVRYVLCRNFWTSWALPAAAAN